MYQHRQAAVNRWDGERLFINCEYSKSMKTEATNAGLKETEIILKMSKEGEGAKNLDFHVDIIMDDL